MQGTRFSWATTERQTGVNTPIQPLQCPDSWRVDKEDSKNELQYFINLFTQRSARCGRGFAGRGCGMGRLTWRLVVYRLRWWPGPLGMQWDECCTAGGKKNRVQKSQNVIKNQSISLLCDSKKLVATIFSYYILFVISLPHFSHKLCLLEKVCVFTVDSL